MDVDLLRYIFLDVLSHTRPYTYAPPHSTAGVTPRPVVCCPSEVLTVIDSDGFRKILLIERAVVALPGGTRFSSSSFSLFQFRLFSSPLLSFFFSPPFSAFLATFDRRLRKTGITFDIRSERAFYKMMFPRDCIVYFELRDVLGAWLEPRFGGPFA